jgi:hypothetical protein
MVRLGWNRTADLAAYRAFDDARRITGERLMASGGFR